MVSWWGCAACGRCYTADGYVSPPMALGVASHGMCPPCADSAFAAERDHLAAEGQHALAEEWEAERVKLRAASPHWFLDPPPPATQPNDGHNGNDHRTGIRDPAGRQPGPAPAGRSGRSSGD